MKLDIFFFKNNFKKNHHVERLVVGTVVEGKEESSADLKMKKIVSA